MKIKVKLSNKDIEQLVKLDEQNYQDQSYYGIPQKCIKWYKKNNEIYIALVDDRAIGYICFCPLTCEAYKNYMNGIITDSDITEDDIETYVSGKTYNCLFMSIVIEKEYRDGKAIKMLLNSYYEKLKELEKRNIKINKILAECVSDDGEKLIKKMGFIFVGLSDRNTKMYELSN